MSRCTKCGTPKAHYVSGCSLPDATCDLVADAFHRGVRAGMDHVNSAASRVQYTYSIPWDELNRNRPQP